MTSSSSGPACCYLHGKVKWQEVIASSADDSVSDRHFTRESKLRTQLGSTRALSQMRGKSRGYSSGLAMRPEVLSWVSPLTPRLTGAGALNLLPPTLHLAVLAYGAQESTGLSPCLLPPILVSFPQPQQVSSSFMTSAPLTWALEPPSLSVLPFLPSPAYLAWPANMLLICAFHKDTTLPRACRSDCGAVEKEVTTSSAAAHTSDHCCHNSTPTTHENHLSWQPVSV